MQASEALLHRFYEAFQRRDHATMTACYGPEATFSDPVFPALRGTEVGAMWRMLCERGADLRIAFGEVEANADRGSARWEAWYTFSATNRPVHNVIQASFEFRAGLILHHRDRFDLYRWARQALGLKGILLGWAPPVQRAIRGQAARALEGFISKHQTG